MKDDISVKPKSDLHGTEDIRALVDAFYAKVQVDPVLYPIFNDVARIDWNHHLPIMYRFWETLLFRSGGYDGNPYSKHVILPIGTEHFQRWLLLFLGTVDELYAGAKAEEAKRRALTIATMFKRGMNLESAENPSGNAKL